MKKKKNSIKSEDRIIQDFLGNFNKRNTLVSYKSYLNNFFNFLDVDPSKYITDVRVLENMDKIKQLDIYEKDVKKFWKHLIDEEYAPKTVKANISCIRVFLQENRIELDNVFWRKLNKRGNGSSSVIIDKTPTHKMMKELLNHADTKGRALFLMMSSSGLRLDEALKIKISDINLKNPDSGEASKILIPSGIAKNKRRAITFMTPEATNTVLEWFKIRSKYLKTKHKRTPIERTFRNRGVSFSSDVNRYDDNLFPFSENTAEMIWNNLLKKAGYDEKDTSTKRTTYVYRVHTLRKFFKRNFKDETSEVFLNHAETLVSTYKNLDEDDLKKIYQENMDGLLIYEKPADQIEIIREQKLRIKQLYGYVDDLRTRLGLQKIEEEEMKQREKIQEQINKEEESMSPEEKEKQRKTDMRIYERAIEFSRKEKEKEAAKTPEQKAEEKRKTDKQLKKLKETMQ